MCPLIIGIGGAHNGSGNTTAACAILKSFTGWGVIKYTRTSLYSCIIDDIAVLSEADKDIKKFLDAGAEKVLWIKSPLSELHQVFSSAVTMFTHLQGIVIAGNSAIQAINPDIVLYVYGDEADYKSGNEKIPDVAHIILFQKTVPASISDDIPKFQLNDTDGFLRSLRGLLRKIRE